MNGRRNSILTESKGRPDLAGDFFDEVLLPWARSQPERRFFPLGAEPGAESYFTEPSRRVMTPVDFVLRGAESRAEFIDELMAMWRRQGDDDLTAMRERLAELAEKMTAADSEESETELPAFIYAMF